MTGSLGVAFLGAGPVTQAIHLPVLNTMPDHFQVCAVMDLDADLADTVARRCGARGVTDADDAIHDPAVDVVAICSPNAVHADQVVASCEAGKKAILCEKPLATSVAEVERIRAAAKACGTHILVGTMHAFDPAYRAVLKLWNESGDRARLVQSSIYLPSNDIFVDQATDLAKPLPARGRVSNPAAHPDATMFEAAMLGLAIHDIPLIRDYFPVATTLDLARFVSPFGFAVVLSDDLTVVRLGALMPGKWPPKWTFRVIGDRCELRVTFPPSYVLSGSALAEFNDDHGTRSFVFEESGYQGQWRNLSAMIRNHAVPVAPFSTAIDDTLFATDLAARGASNIGRSA